jgi:transposase
MNWLGIDVAKASLAVALQLGERRRLYERQFDNDARGIARLQQWVQERGAELSELTVVMESTGVYHEQVALALHEAGCTVIVANPKRVRDFAKGLGLLHKTDTVDARALTRYATQKGAELLPFSPPPPEIRALRALHDRLSAVQEDLQREENRRQQALISTAEAGLVIDSLERSVQRLRAECELLKRAIEDHFDQHPGLKSQRELLQSIPSIGPISGDRLLCVLLTHRFDNARQAAAFCGLIPVTYESGSSVRGRPRLSKQGDGQLRSKLYMAAIVAVQRNEQLRQVYDSLLAAGKTKMSALGALMRRLVHIAFGVLKHQMPYNPELVGRKA